jgi:hypothetical protein
MADDVLDSLRAASAGLLFPSERDQPLEAFVWTDAGAELDASALRRRLGLPADAPVERVDPDEFFADAVARRDWHGAAEKDSARRFRILVEVLKDRLSGLRAFRVGRVEIDAYVVGRTARGDWAGVRATLIET